MKDKSSQAEKKNIAALQYKSIVDSLTVPTFVIDTHHVVTAWNKACEQLTGVKAEDVIGTNEAWRGFYDTPRPCLADVVVDQAGQNLSSLYPTHGKAKFSQGLHAENWFPNINGKRRYLIFDAQPIYDQDGNLLGAVENLQDVAEIKLVQERLAISDRVFDTINQAILITDAENKIMAVNQAFTNLTGYAQDEIVGKNPRILSSGRQPPEFYQQMWQSLASQGYWEGDVWDRRKDGEVYPKWLSITKVVDEKTNEVSSYIALFSDISERKKTEEETLRLAFHDNLTGLANRLLLRDRLQHAITNAYRKSTLIAVIFIDLDGFKAVNDTFGHDVGDVLLQEVATKLRNHLRESDTIARLGGDEFVAVVPDLISKRFAHLVASKLLQAIAQDCTIKSHEIKISPSIGIAIYPHDGADVDTLLSNADKAMYHVKKSGKNNIQLFNN